MHTPRMAPDQSYSRDLTRVRAVATLADRVRCASVLDRTPGVVRFPAVGSNVRGSVNQCVAKALDLVKS